MSIRVIYSDVDGTMVGPGGCFFREEGGAPTLEPARALVELLAAGIELVLVSGRSRAQLMEASRIVGATGYIAELGAIIGRGDEVELLPGATPPGIVGVPQGIVDGLLERYQGRLEYHAPWHLGHETDVLLHGKVDVLEAEAWLATWGGGWLRLRDNGLVARSHMPGLDGSGPPRVYHLMADGVSKGAAVAHDLRARGLVPAQAIAVGDSSSDLEMAATVGRMHLVGNALRHPDIATLLEDRANANTMANVVVEPGTLGAGWTTAVTAAIGASEPSAR